MAVSEVSWSQAKADIVELLDSDQDIWPADNLGFKTKKKSYIGLFVRLAWHCSGSYRESDGRGVSLYDSTFSRTVWRLYGGAKGLAMWYYQVAVKAGGSGSSPS